jgi:hypothetical protein
MRALRFVIGAAIAFAIWWYATPAYNDLLCRILRIFGTLVAANGRTVDAMHAGFANAHIPADQLTYNVVLFTGLVAAKPPRVFATIVATLVLLAIHPFALWIDIEAVFTKDDLWIALDFLYRIGGMFAIAFACWYASTTPFRELQPGRPRKSATAERARPRAAATRR